MNAKKTLSMKTVALLLAVVLLIGCVAGGTIAYLVAETQTVTNTFVAGEIGTLKLEEKDTTNKDDAGNYIIVPGTEIKKDPVVTYTPAKDAKKNVSAFIFVNIINTKDAEWTLGADKKTFTADELSWEIADGWIYLSDNVFYRKAEDAEVVAPIIKGDIITIGTGIEKGDDMAAAVAATSGLSFTVYAIQQDGFADAEAAWAELSNT